MRARTWTMAIVLSTIGTLFVTAVPADAAKKEPRERIAYVAPSPDEGILTVDLHGRHHHRLTPKGGDATSPTWSPSGNQIAYLRGFSGGGIGTPSVYRDLRVMRPNGRGKRTLLTGGQVRTFTDLAWAPRARRVAVTMHNRTEGVDDVAVYTLTSRTLVRLHLFDGTGWIPWNIDWSPDGQRLILSAYQLEDGNPHDIGTSDLWTVRPDGTGLQRLTNTTALEFSPVWAPDGRRIAYTEGFNCAPLVIANADGTPRRRVAGCRNVPDWAPGGARLVVASSRIVTIIRPDGSDPRPVARGYYPAWRPR